MQNLGIRLEAAYLYGSYAKGYAHKDSDIDVALVSPDLTGWVDDFEKMRPALLEMDSRIEPVRFHPDNFREENPLAWEVKTTGIPLLGNGKNDKRRAATKRKRNMKR
ncbi:MAG: nucleotidyltransferase domain-containing protein [Chloroflexi bacterium]|nr:nucleotidyltransferase domain-containing protein [Chloroflexota bacterium]